MSSTVQYIGECFSNTAHSDSSSCDAKVQEEANAHEAVAKFKNVRHLEIHEDVTWKQSLIKLEEYLVEHSKTLGHIKNLLEFVTEKTISGDTTS